MEASFRPPLDFLRDCGCPEELLLPERLEILSRLRLNLVSVNAELNLSRLLDEREFWIMHVADAMLAARVRPDLLSASLRVADVGCGAGFPLFPLAWANPLLDITGIDSDPKRIGFVLEQAAALGFAKVSAIARQAREAGRLPGHQGAYDLVVARAVSRACNLIRDCRQLLRPGGVLLLYKTPEGVAEEMELAEREARKFRLRLAESAIVELPDGAGRRQFLLATCPE